MAQEYQSLTNPLTKGKAKGYGAAIASSYKSNAVPCMTISHTVSSTDSLPALAIRYNSTVADIKRRNKLWSNDGLSFRTTIDIPVYEHTSTSNSQPSTSSAKLSDISVTLDSEDARNGALPDVVSSSQSASGLVGLSPTDASPNDFFAKFDQSLSLLKEKVANQRDSEEMDLRSEGNFVRTKVSRNGGSKGEGSNRSSRSSIRSTDDVKTTPEPVIRAKVKKKMKKHEERQEELFTL